VSALGLSPVPSPAVTFDFTARVTSIDTVIFPGVNIGDIVSGSYSFNPATPDNFPANSLFGIYGDLTSLALALLTIPGLFWWTRRTRHIGS
jgi:hypothetical protein